MELPANITSIISFVLLLLGAYSALFLIALVVWTFRDIRSRSRDVLLQILATLLVLVFNVPGLILYFILRPQCTLDEAYEHALGQEAMLQDIEERYICPSCRRKAEADYLVCPHCHAQLRERCPDCERLISLNWDVCPYCGSGRVVSAEPQVVTEPTESAVMEPPASEAAGQLALEVTEPESEPGEESESQ